MSSLGGWIAAALLLPGAQVPPPRTIDGNASLTTLHAGKPHPPIPIGNIGQWFGPDAYPPEAIAANEQGRVVARVTVGTDGKPTACAVVTSSGSFALDNGTCAIVMANITFEAAVATDGRVITGYYPLAVRWVMPKPVTPGAATGTGAPPSSAP